MRVQTLYYADGRIEPGNDADWPIEKLQKFVGGYIEVIRIGEQNRALVVNEEGYIHCLPRNIAATKLIRVPVMMGNGSVCGNAALVKVKG